MEEAWEFAVVSVPCKASEVIPSGGAILELSESDDVRLRDIIDTIRRMETNTTLYAAGAFAPALILLNQLQFLTQAASQSERYLALFAMLILGFSGLVMVIYRAFYINLKRTSVEFLLAKSIEGGRFNLHIFESKVWRVILTLAFLAMPVGWFLVGVTIWQVLF